MKMDRSDTFQSKWFIGITCLKVITIYAWIPKDMFDVTIPSVDHFIRTFSDAWPMFYEGKEFLETFPYPSGMLFILALFFWPVVLFELDGQHLQTFFIQLPTLLADMLIYYVLLRTFPTKQKRVMFIYYGSPLIFIASYIYPHHDLLPIAALLLSVFYLLRKQHVIAAVFYAVGLSLKMPVIFALPLLLIYFLKMQRTIDVMKFSIIALGTWFLLSSPFLFSKGYQLSVFYYEDQFKMLDIYLEIDYLKIYVAPLVIALIYIHFFRFDKINADLLYTYLGMLYFAFVLFIPPMPHWYAWSFVFASFFFIKTYENKHSMYQYLLLTTAYLGYFIFFYPNTNPTLLAISEFFHIDQNDSFVPNLIFTLFEGILLCLIWIFYRYGIISNSLYKVRLRPTVIGIGGDSGVGKTTLTKGLMNLFGAERLLIVEGDGDHKWERGHEKWKEYTHLNPKANFLHEQASTLERLKNGNSAKRVEYDHQKGSFTNPQKIDPNDFIVMCGLHPLLLARTRKVLDLKIYLDTDEQLRRHWKIIRDCNERGYSIEKLMKQIDARMEDAKKYIYPQRKYADIIIKYYTDKPFAIGNPDENPAIQLKITCDADVFLEHVLEEMDNANISYTHDYHANLKHQMIKLHAPIDRQTVHELANLCIENLNEVTRGHMIEWRDGYEAFIQLIILVFISEKMKGR